MHKVDELMAMQPSTSKQTLEDTSSLIRLRKPENFKVQTRSASSAKRKPASPRKRATTLHEGGSTITDTGETGKQQVSSIEELPRKPKSPVCNSSLSASGPQNDCSTKLSTSAVPGSFPFACDLATLTGIQALASLSSATTNETAEISDGRPDLKLEKKPITTSLENSDPTPLCPDLAKTNTLLSTNAAALAATMNGLLLAGTVNVPDATAAQVPANRELFAAFTALGLVPFLGDSANIQANEDLLRTKQGIDSSLLETTAVSAAGTNLGVFGSDLKAVNDFFGKTMPTGSSIESGVASASGAEAVNLGLGKGHARRVKQKSVTFPSSAIVAQDQQKKSKEVAATKKLFTSLQNELPFVSRNTFSKENEGVGGDTRNGSKEERIDLEELENFAQTFKKQRIKFGFTQGDVGMALGRRYGTDFSQTTISRFEALNLSFKNMCKLRPLLKEWLADAEAAIASGASVSDLLEAPSKNSSAQVNGNNGDIINGKILPGSPSPSGITLNSAVIPLRKRRKRTNLDATQRAALDQFFKVNPRPDHDKMAQIAEMLELDRDVIRVWFCNRRQKVRKE